MEYNLLIEQKKRKYVFIAILVAYFVLLFLSYSFLGLRGVILSLGLLIFSIITPLLVGRYKLFLLLWIVISPFSNFLPFLQVGPINLLNFFIIGLSFPFATLMIYEKNDEVSKSLPYIIPMFIMILTVLLNIVRPEVAIMGVFQHFKFHFFTIFIICCTYFYLKNNPLDNLFKWINIIAIINALASVFQRFTGIGIQNVAGHLRSPGITMHPNACGFLINITFCIQMYMFLRAKNLKSKIFWGSSLFFNFIALAFTISKTSYLIFAMVLFILFFYLPKKLKIISAGLMAFSLMSFVVIDSALGFGVIQTFKERLGTTASLDWRMWLWGMLIKNINFGTILWGNGIDSIRRFTAIVSGGFQIVSHNGYLQMIYEYGLWGLIYLSSYFYVFIKFVKAVLKRNKAISRLKKVENIIPVLIPLIVLVEMMADEALANRIPMYYSWIAITGFYLQQKSQEELPKDLNVI